MTRQAGLVPSPVLLILIFFGLLSGQVQLQRRNPTGRIAVIKGELSYPSEGIPPELVVCAEDLRTASVTCQRTNDRDRRYDLTFELRVPPGSYFIFTTLPYDAEDNKGSSPSQRRYRAYYSEYVRCVRREEGRGAEICSSHEPVRVSVRAGQVVSGVDPGDWYNH
jgi:hypothetical protein